MSRIAKWVIVSIVCGLGVSACAGDQPEAEQGEALEVAELAMVADPRIPADYFGWSMCTGEPSVIVREYPYANAQQSEVKPSCKYGEKAWVRAVVPDSYNPSGARYAKLPGWGMNGTHGYANWNYFTPGYPLVDSGSIDEFLTDHANDNSLGWLRGTEFVAYSPAHAQALIRTLTGLELLAIRDQNQGKSNSFTQDTALTMSEMIGTVGRVAVGNIITMTDWFLGHFTLKLGGSTPGKFMVYGPRQDHIAYFYY
jgi:hypothetical protein